MVSLPPMVASSTLRPSGFISLARHLIACFGCVQVWELPAETFAEITGMEMVGVVALRDDRRVGFALGGVAVIDADQDHLLETHVDRPAAGQHRSPSRPSQSRPPRISGKFWPAVGGMQEDHVLTSVGSDCASARKGIWALAAARISSAHCSITRLLTRQVIAGRKTQLRKHQVDTVHPKGGFVSQPG